MVAHEVSDARHQRKLQVGQFNDLGATEFHPRLNFAELVAQVSNLLYRPFPTGVPGLLPGALFLSTFSRLEVGDTAGWKPALQGWCARSTSVFLMNQGWFNPNAEVGSRG